MFSPERRHELLELARRALAHYLETGRILEAPPAPGGEKPPTGVFVTLRRQRRLRGCIGVVGTGDPLDRCVVRCCLAAATEDPRFQEVRPEELPDLTLEISVLSPLVPVSSPEEIVVGRDGLQIEREGRRGLLLPQVPAEQGWDRDAYLEALCRKAGLPADAWRTGARIQRFTAEVFSQEKGPGEPGP
jgi:AmmeMemoRadiSam system protein A